MSKQAATGDKTAKRLFDILSRYKAALEQGKSARTVELDKEDRKAVHDLHLLTDKPVLYVCNVDEKSAAKGNSHVDAVREAIRDENAELLIVAAATEADIAELETYEERQMFRAEVIKYGDYVALGSEKACREAGKIAVEGKEYIVQDGDIMHFLFNV